ncbi:hypothetical protein [Aeoliella mucimassa]|uniref:Uncharacterized protein n=1 Tax=Aeoliella mucimassa TaxID=2527972 RepID=A0A518AN24_9BACT|nr:hypothetical protein [Aeoliella mucimassa]QDU56120.1 hypothetical protein Pan181_23240 [Aeoliella mucimassa]
MFTQIVVWLNALANALGRVLLAPVGWMPGWLSATLVGAVTGVLMIIVFKHTSNQQAIKRTRNRIKANMLALSLFKENLWVSFRCQGRLLASAGMLLWYSLVPMAVLTVPMILILGQLALWYQVRPLDVGEPSVVTVMLSDAEPEAVDKIELASTDGAKVVTGPVRVPSKQMVCWELEPTTVGMQQLDFVVGDKTYTKELSVGDVFQPTSIKRPALLFGDVVLHPRETPFAADSTVQSIEVTYPDRSSWTSGTNYWMVYWFLISMVAAFAAKPFLNVNL